MGSRTKLSPAAKSLLQERDRIVGSWRNLTVTPELAVERLNTLAATDADGTMWRLMPRETGVALVRTTIDGDATVVEPPMTLPRWTAIVCLVFLVLLGGAAVWSYLRPVAAGSDRTEIPAVTATAPVGP